MIKTHCRLLSGKVRYLLASLLLSLTSACAGIGAGFPVSPTPGNIQTAIQPSTAEPVPSATRQATHTPTRQPGRTPTRRPSATPTRPLPTPSPTESPVVFAVIGDYGQAGPGAAAVAALVQGWNPDFIITTGDNNYPSGGAGTIDTNIGQYYHAYIHPYQGDYGEGGRVNRFFPSLGNHDLDTAMGQAYLDYFTLPGNERYYEFSWGPVHLFALNSDSREPDGVTSTSTQAAWLEAQLAASEQPWKIVYMHLPPYSSGLHGSAGWMRWPFREWGATAVLSGHNHVYERVLVDGLPFIVNGLGGFLRYQFNEPLPTSQVRYNAEYGALRVDATAGQIHFQFVNTAGEVIDRFTLTAEGN